MKKNLLNIFLYFICTTFVYAQNTDYLHPKNFVRINENTGGDIYDILTSTDKLECKDTIRIVDEKVNYVADRYSKIQIGFYRDFLLKRDDFEGEISVTAQKVSGSVIEDIQVPGYSQIGKEQSIVTAKVKSTIYLNTLFNGVRDIYKRFKDTLDVISSISTFSSSEISIINDISNQDKIKNNTELYLLESKKTELTVSRVYKTSILSLDAIDTSSSIDDIIKHYETIKKRIFAKNDSDKNRALDYRKSIEDTLELKDKLIPLLGSNYKTIDIEEFFQNKNSKVADSIFEKQRNAIKIKNDIDELKKSIKATETNLEKLQKKINDNEKNIQELGNKIGKIIIARMAIMENENIIKSLLDKISSQEMVKLIKYFSRRVGINEDYILSEIREINSRLDVLRSNKIDETNINAGTINQVLGAIQMIGLIFVDLQKLIAIETEMMGIKEKIIGGLKDTELLLSTLDLKEGDGVVIIITNNCDLDGAPRTLTVKVTIGEFGLINKISDSIFFIRRNGVTLSSQDTNTDAKEQPRDVNYEPAPGTTYQWILQIRKNPKICGFFTPMVDVVRFFSPGFGLNVSLPRFGSIISNYVKDNTTNNYQLVKEESKSNLDVALGLVFSIFNNTVSITYGWNLTSGRGSDREYFGIGFSFIGLYNKAKGIVE